jgi:hypothetical protein
MYRIAAFGLLLLILGVLSGGVLALVGLLLGAFTYAVRILDEDIDPYGGMVIGFASRL